MGDSLIQQHREQRQRPIKTSALVPFGIGLIFVGLFLPTQLENAAKSMQRGSTSWRILLIATDLFSMCFFAGFAPLIIGLLRNRKQRQQV